MSKMTESLLTLKTSDFFSKCDKHLFAENPDQIWEFNIAVL